MQQIDSQQFIFIIVILPGLFGLTLVGEGLYKIFKEESGGITSLIFGILFLVMVFAVVILVPSLTKMYP